MPLDVVKGRTLQATVWDCDRFQENVFLGAVKIPLEKIFGGAPRDSSGSSVASNISSGDPGVRKWFSLTNLRG